jgi:hypothetical protein
MAVAAIAKAIEPDTQVMHEHIRQSEFEQKLVLSCWRLMGLLSASSQKIIVHTPRTAGITSDCSCP